MAAEAEDSGGGVWCAGGRVRAGDGSDVVPDAALPDLLHDGIGFCDCFGSFFLADVVSVEVFPVSG